MKLKLSYGYPIPHPEAVQVIDYAFNIGDSAATSDVSTSPAWDYETPVSCLLRLEVDLHRLLTESGLISANDPAGYEPPRLAASLSWLATRTKQRGGSPRVELSPGINELAVTLPGEILGGTLKVNAVIALMESAAFTDDRLAPKALGTVLWTSDEFHLPLEGEGSRFTMTPVNFAQVGIQPKNAMWLVRISDNLEVPVTSGVRVLMNTSNKITVSMLENPASPDAEMWQKSLEAEVMTLMALHGSTVLTDFSGDPDFDAGSLGESLVALIDSLFPHDTYADLLADTPRVASTVKASVFNGRKA